MIRTAIIGAGGRMGRRLVALTVEDPELELSGAVDAYAAFHGTDAGDLAGVGCAGVPISESFADVVKKSDAAIDFSAPQGLDKRLALALEHDCALIIGTTGLTDDQKALIAKTAEQGARIVFAPNMSVGVNLLFNLCAKVARILGEDYDSVISANFIRPVLEVRPL